MNNLTATAPDTDDAPEGPATEPPFERITILAVHGNGGGGFRFSLLPRTLSAKSAESPEVVLYPLTLPGFEGLPLPPRASMATFGDALDHEIENLDLKNDEPLVLLGHGIGGSIVLDFLAQHPDRADGVILHALVGANLDTRLFPRIMKTRPVRSLIKMTLSSWAAQTIGSRILFREAPPSFRKRFLAEYRRCAAFSLMFDLLTADWFQNLPQLDLPAILLWGADDRVLEQSHVAEFEAKLTNSETVIQPDWGHFPMIDAPEAYASVVSSRAISLCR